MPAPAATTASARRALAVALGLFAIQGAACISLAGLTGGRPGARDDDSSLGTAGPEGGTSDVTITDGAAPSAPESASSANPEDAGSISATPTDSGTSTPAEDAATGITEAPLLFGSPTSSSPTIGGDSGAPFSEACPAGAAMVGLNLLVDTDDPFALLAVQALCATVTVSGSGTIGMSALESLAAQGDGGSGLAGTVRCPDGSVLVGMSATAAQFVHAVLLECDELQTVSEGDGRGIMLGKGTLVGPFGGSGGNPVPAFQCPPPSVATSLSGTAGGGGFIDSLVLGCATPSVP